MADRRRIGIVIGVNRSPLAPDLANLTAPEQAARDLAAVLRAESSRFDIPDARLFLGPQATVSAIKDAIRAARSNLTAEDVLLISFCGHGVPLTSHPHGRDVFLATADFDPTKVAADEELGLSMRWLRDKALLWAGPGHVVMLLDCCHAGFIGESAIHPRVADLQAEIDFHLTGVQKTFTLTASPPPKTRVAIVSTMPGRQASAKWRHTVFSKMLLQGIKDGIGARLEDGTVTTESLHAFITKNLGKQQYCGRYGYDYGSIVLAWHDPPGHDIDRGIGERLQQALQRLSWRTRALIVTTGLLLVLLYGGLGWQAQLYNWKQQARYQGRLMPVRGSAFSMEEHEVTVGRYTLCVAADACAPVPDLPSSLASESLPVTMVDAVNAQNFCRWIDRRLPTLQEWEAAAATIPWRTRALSNQEANLFHETGLADATLEPVGSFPGRASGDGIYDLIGNAYEWTTTPWQQPTTVWNGENTDLHMAGGSYLISPGNEESIPVNVGDHFEDYGFRCVQVP